MARTSTKGFKTIYTTGSRDQKQRYDTTPKTKYQGIDPPKYPIPTSSPKLGSQKSKDKAIYDSLVKTKYEGHDYPKTKSLGYYPISYGDWNQDYKGKSTSTEPAYQWWDYFAGSPTATSTQSKVFYGASTGTRSPGRTSEYRPISNLTRSGNYTDSGSASSVSVSEWAILGPVLGMICLVVFFMFKSLISARRRGRNTDNGAADGDDQNSIELTGQESVISEASSVKSQLPPYDSTRLPDYSS
ncbi:hypothetical protein FT663_03654 [Candidozyma haemuli var. vulneris]|nr:hypothetical protein FT662_04940 [[Candida] haemuloni var. vulneris]KAF3989378.1 hypothetical protein FT663_03654 [[Candida] haemuloni var. vulneris]